MKPFQLRGVRLLLAISSSALLFTACSPSAEGGEGIFRLSGTLSGAAERPTPANTPATGTISGVYNNFNNRLEYTIRWTGLTNNPVAAHFHGPAGPEEVAPPVIGITGFPANTALSYTGTNTLTEDQERQLLEGKWYFNIHTPTYPGGEIRGQVIVQ